jgi:outer membrane protein assembly factor BamB
MQKGTGPIFLGVGNHVVALDPLDGHEIWRTKLKTSSYVTVLVLPDRVIAGCGGEAFGLDPATGTILWRNKLKGLGIGLVAFGSPVDAVQAAALDAQRAAAAA